MGVASYREDDLTRYLEATETPAVWGPWAPVYRCPFCSETFEDRQPLNDHLSSRHRGHRPILLVGGWEPDRITTIRQRLWESHIAIENCSDVHVRVNGIRRDGLLQHNIPRLLAQETDAVIELELVNKFNDLASPVRQSYRLEFCIPNKSSLDAVDRAFIEHLSIHKLEMAQVSTFLGDRRCEGVVCDYADALGSYARGLLVKNQAIGTGVTLPPSEADDLYGSALMRLKDFQRPLTTVFCGLVRFGINDFSFTYRPTEFLRLDRCNVFLSPLAGCDAPSVEIPAGDAGQAVVDLCPFDQAIDRVLDLAERLGRQTQWGPTLHEDCRQASEARTLGARDRAKVRALWATTSLRLGAGRMAVEPLRQLRASHPFGAWATEQLDRKEELGDGNE